MAPAHPRGWVAGCFFLFFFSSFLLFFFSSFLLFFFSSSLLLFFFSFLKKRSKRKSVTEQLFFSAVAVFACILHKTGGSHASRPFFMSWAGCTGKGLASVNPLSRAVFHFFSSRKAMGASSLSFENRSKENQLRNSCFSLLLLFSPAYCTKRTVPMRAVRFLCHGQDASGTGLLPSIPCPALSFISFLQEKKTSPFLK